jgi:ketosteroid isomerase-like protein
MKNLELAKTGYEKFSKDDIDGVLAMFDPNIEWHSVVGLPFIKSDGVYHGPKAVADHIFSKLPQNYENFRININELLEAGDRVIMIGNYTGTWKATGKKFKANAVHVWTIKNGKMTKFYEAADTATIVSPVKAAAYK